MKKLLVLTILLTLAFTANAQWTLSNDQSSLNFISVKKSTIAEIHKFNSLSGSITDGKVVIEIDLSSVETNIPVRNDRIKALLFEVIRFPKATIITSIDPVQLQKMESGDNKHFPVTLSANLHGVTKDIQTEVHIIKLSNNNILVYSKQPLIINAADFKLNEGVEALREIAKLPVISKAVPVTFNFVFKLTK